MHFRNMCGVCDTPINIKRWCSRCEKEVPYENINKGFPVEKDRFVVFSPKELEALEPEGGGAITVDKFVDTSKITPIAYDSFYFVAPDKEAERAYSLMYALSRHIKRGCCLPHFIFQMR